MFDSEVRDPVSPLGIHLCSTKYFPFFASFAWVPIGGFEILILLLAFYAAMQYHEVSAEIGNCLSIFWWTKINKLGYILLRDSITFPFL